MKRACPFYIGLPPRNEEKEASRSERPLLVGCQRIFEDGGRCGGSWEAHYGYSAGSSRPASGGSQGVAVEPPKRAKRNERLAALEARYKAEMKNG